MEQLMAHAMSSHNQPQHQFHPGQVVGPSYGPPGMVLHQQALMGNPNMGMNQHPSVSLQIPDPNKLVKQEQNFGKMQQPQHQPPPPPVSSFSQDCQYPLMSPAPLAQNLTLKKEKSPISSEGSSFDSEREDPWLNNGKSKSTKKKGKNSNQTRRASEPGGQNSSSSGAQKRRFSTSTTIIQEKEKPFECTTCGRRFTQRIGMLQHQRRHTGERPFACTFCEKKFTQKSGLVQHERLHTNEKPFGCSFCERCFTQKSGLVQHERTHTGEKPYVCQICSKAFTQLSGLKQHKKVHERSSETSASK